MFGQNPSKDVGLPNADIQLIKADLAAGIMRVLTERQSGGAKPLGWPRRTSAASAVRRSTALRSTAWCGSSTASTGRCRRPSVSAAQRPERPAAESSASVSAISPIGPAQPNLTGTVNKLGAAGLTTV
jgi:hypothetical protein